MFEDIDTTIQSVERLYRAVSGRDANGAEGAPIPPERDAAEHVDDQVDRLLGALAAAVPAVTGARAEPAAWAPPVTVFTRRDELVVCVDLPGVPRESVTVNAMPQWVRVEGRRPLRLDDGQARPASCETPFGAFRRDIALPPDVSPAGVTATLKDGVLELRVPRAQRPQARPISIQ